MWAASSFFTKNNNETQQPKQQEIKNSSSIPSLSNPSNKNFSKNTSISSSQSSSISSSPKNSALNINQTWPNNHVQCVIVTKNPRLIQAYKNAISAWNRTRAFDFQLTNNPNAPLKLSETDLSNTTQSNNGWTTTELGITKNSFYDKPRGQVSAEVDLDNTQTLLGRPDSYLTLVAEHELGHAMGLSHAPANTKSVMVPYNVQVPIQQTDIDNVKQLYNEK